MVDHRASDEEFERKGKDLNVDPNWDTMVSNPEYREAFNAAEREGYSTEESHILAHAEVWNKKHALEKFDEETVEELIDDEEVDGGSRATTDSNEGTRGDTNVNWNRDNETGSYTLDDF
ncbi:hypothetical protein [Haloplanus aerogenes]|uniref:Uncharacterized protein n=1 Tax=Haloplanus aerogenes TaxID=660522 RepID=A0A3M0DTT3_9EURY|nr:hypothetical protein [Haloplanus aerogenes]AZH25662.1 hypothetical protein DU502_09850 [Haloplanus aerogenes]RMB25391.1 hypothetical protein ATH50_0480 [Haloplanus aerogenes]